MNVFFFLQIVLMGYAHPSTFMEDRESSEYQAQPTDKQYCNGRFNYCVDYPAALKPQPESANGDGRIFTDEKGVEALRVWGSLNGDAEGNPQTLQAKFKEATSFKQGEGYSITYRVVNKDYFILSGKRKLKVFYQKTILKEDAFVTALVSGDQSNPGRFKNLSQLVFKSFH